MFPETKLGATPIRDLGLTIAGTPLDPVLAEFERELDDAGIRQVRPHFYLSTEWGVNFGTITIGIPFYLARPDLATLHAERVGHLEGTTRADLLRYLRHEMGHVINYAYKLYEQEDWIKLFGSMTQPYIEEFRPEPFSRRFVRHLPGWYAQKHPDEDWAETFAVWMTPHFDWHSAYTDWPEALAKLTYCDRTMAALSDRPPLVMSRELDEPVGDLTYSVDQFYRGLVFGEEKLPPGLDGALSAIFQDWRAELKSPPESRAAGQLLRRLEPILVANVYCWTGHFPERTRRLVRHLVVRADGLALSYPPERETEATVAITTLVTALAMNYVHRGSYLP
jgi:hypothetical protein